MQSQQSIPSARGAQFTTPILFQCEMPPDFLSATFKMVGDLHKDRSHLTLDFECQSAGGRRFTDMTIVWKFEPAYCSTPPTVLHAEPQQAEGKRTDEVKCTTVGGGVTHPILGVQVQANVTTTSVISHAMTVIGTVRGDPLDHCVWIVKENRNAATGIPPHFRIMVDLKHDDHFVTTMSVTTKVAREWRLPRIINVQRKRLDIDIGMLKSTLEGEVESPVAVPHADTVFSSIPVP